MTSNVWHCFCTYCKKEHRCLLHHVTQRLDGTYSIGSKTKSIRPRPRPVWDPSCYKTAVSDPKTGRRMSRVRIWGVGGRRKSNSMLSRAKNVKKHVIICGMVFIAWLCENGLDVVKWPDKTLAKWTLTGSRCWRPLFVFQFIIMKTALSNVQGGRTDVIAEVILDDCVVYYC